MSYDIAFILTHPETWGFELLKMFISLSSTDSLYKEIVKVASGSTGSPHVYDTKLGKLYVYTDKILGVVSTGITDANSPPTLAPSLYQQYQWWKMGFDIERIYANGMWYLVKFQAKLELDPSIEEQTIPFTLSASTLFGQASTRQQFTIVTDSLIGGEIDVDISFSPTILWSALYINGQDVTTSKYTRYVDKLFARHVSGDISGMITIGTNTIQLDGKGSGDVTASGTIKIVAKKPTVQKQNPQVLQGTSPAGGTQTGGTSGGSTGGSPAGGTQNWWDMLAQLPNLIVMMVVVIVIIMILYMLINVMHLFKGVGG
jgi:hypothetical protein